MKPSPFRTIARLGTLLLLPLLVACSSTGVGNPGATGTLSLAIVGDELDSDEPTGETADISDAGASPDPNG